MSCAFVVCDVGAHDLPIVYCSDIFERMTGYSRHEILGQNCRFLQSPTGKVQSGVPRKYCDDDTVLFLKKRIQQRKEAQAVIINYRKGGHGFQNLLTMIPITWDTDEIKYFVGFQTDLVEKPSSIISKNPGKFPFDETPISLLTCPKMERTQPTINETTYPGTCGQNPTAVDMRLWEALATRSAGMTSPPS